MQLSELLKSIHPNSIKGVLPESISGITHDSRKVELGNLFVAVPGVKVDGSSFIANALERGATGIVVKTGIDINAPCVVEVANPRASLADLVSHFYGNPSEYMKVVGVTGTDGKTTTSHLIRHLLLDSGYNIGVINTVYIAQNHNEQKNPFALTTPDSPDIQQFLSQTLELNDPQKPIAAILEASSHAIALDRVRAVDFDVAVFTNITSTHLEYHGSFKEYRDIKGRLFSGLTQDGQKGPKFGVINGDDSHAEFFRDRCNVPVIDYGLNDFSQVRGEVMRTGVEGSEFKVWIDGREYKSSTRLQGRFNVSNILAGISTAYGLGIDIDRLMAKIPEIGPVQGRMMEVDQGQPFRVIVDFAHTPGALRAVINSVREQDPKRLGVLIGHAGERDLNNRPELAKVAGDADIVFVTMDDPESEDPAEIAAEMSKALNDDGKIEGKDYKVIIDRRMAMEEALKWADPGDLLLFAGRGHETSIPLGNKKIPFNDENVTRELLHKMGYTR